jgi:alpha-L-fucosidase
LDIGPTGDGRIPVIMEERLMQIGRWLEINGEAIYSTRPWKRTRQFSEGAVPEMKTGEYMIKYDVTDFVDRKKPGQAVIETFFTAKGNDVYAIVPGPPGKELVLKNVKAGQTMTVSMLGGPASLRWTPSGNDIVVTLPEVKPNEAGTQVAHVLKLRGAEAR